MDIPNTTFALASQQRTIFAHLKLMAIYTQEGVYAIVSGQLKDHNGDAENRPK